MEKREVVILTKSSKNKNFCVAGIDVETGRWIRLVEENCDGYVKKETLKNINILDCIKVGIKKSAALTIQTENMILDTNEKIIKIGNITLDNLKAWNELNKYPFIFGNCKYFLSDNEIKKMNIKHSLEIVEVQNLILNTNENCKTKLSFMYNHFKYDNMSVTDPEYYGYDNNTLFKRAVLVVSLPNKPFCGNNGYYKFVSKIFEF